MNQYSHSGPRVKPLRERLRAETERAIAAAAEETFAVSGIREARIEEIAARAGVSVGTVYNHFEDREALLGGLVERRRRELAQKLDAALAGAEAQPFEPQLRKFVRTIFEHFETHRNFLAILLQTDSAQLSRPSESMRELRRRADVLVERGVQKRALHAARRELWGALLLTTIRGLLLAELRDPGKLSLQDREDVATEFFLRGASVR